jgi:hypothetical protein
VKTLTKQFKAAFLILGIASGVLMGTVQQSKAAYYDNYYTYYNYYLSLYDQTGTVQYYYDAVGYYYYYLAGLYGDYYGYYDDGIGEKSPYYRGSATYAEINYNYYAQYGDYYIRL